MIFRITHIAYGELRDGTVTIDAVEDIFGIQNTAFVSPPESGWVNPLGAPAAPAAQRLWEVPYFLLNAALIPLGRYAAALAARGDATSKTFQVWNDHGSFVEDIELADFTPIGTLVADYLDMTHATDTTGFVIHNLLDVSDIESVSDEDWKAGKLLALIDDELIAIKTVTNPGDGTMTLSNGIRGVLDTVRKTHAAGAVVWILAGGLQMTELSPNPADVTIDSKLLPENNFGVYPIGSASAVTLTLNSRFLRPYPPGNLRIGAGAWGVIPTTLSGDLVMTWADRNRLTETAMVAQDATVVTPETGQTDTIKIFVGGVLKQTVGALSTGYTYTAAQRAIDDPDFTKLVTVEIRSTRDGLDSMFFQTFTLQMLGDGSELLPGRYEFTTVDVGGLTV
jgi:hypothetical protein